MKKIIAHESSLKKRKRDVNKRRVSGIDKISYLLDESSNGKINRGLP